MEVHRTLRAVTGVQLPEKYSRPGKEEIPEIARDLQFLIDSKIEALKLP